ncbi:lamin tail domain-containing protein [Polaribacter sp. P097]|uniref:lamin tail domain-containing protein n=1 Tax=Polaribacter sp. P097 TaxID=3117398 RepID=UPI002FDFC68D
MKQKNLFILFFLLFLLFNVNITFSQIYNADFSNNGDGFTDHTTTSAPAAAPAEVGPFGSSGNQWSLSYTSLPATDGSANSFKVVDGALISDDWGGQGIFQSQSIDVSAINSVDISALSQNTGANDNDFKYFYILDGGSRVETANISSSNGDNVNYTITVDVSGVNSIVVGFEFDENGGGDGYTTSSFTVSESAAATPGVSLSAVSGNTNEDGSTATFTLVLDVQPTNDVVLNVSSGDTGEVTVSPSTLTFTNGNWNTPQTVTATGVNDANQDGSVDVTITISVNDALSDDAYDPIADVTTTVTNEDDELPNLVINEFMADPDATNGDANGDGSVDTSQDEFIEIYNASGSELNIGGYTIEDSSGLRHTFPKGTILPTAGTIVVFGGGTPTNIPSLTQVSSVGFLGLNNGGDTITIKDAGGTVVTSYSYSSEGGNNISLARNPDLTGSFVTHDNVTGNGGVLFSPGRDNTDNTGFYNTWSGTTNNVWSTATNWLDSDNPSAASDNIYIPSGLTNYPTTSSAVTVNATFVGSGASLIAQSTYSGTIYYQRNLGTTNWYLVSSPVGGENMTDMRANNDFASGTASNIGFAPYDNSQASSNDRWDYFANTATTALVDGKGYSTKLASAGNITFSGSMNVSDFTSINLSDNSGGSGNAFNLLGNPYPSFISISSLLSANDSGGNNLLTESTIWIWNEGTSTYDQRNSATTGANAFIAPGQGFFVNADGASTTFNITEVMQSHGSGESFQKNSRTEIKLFLSDESKIRKSEIYYINGTTTNFDNGYDSSIFGGITNDFQVYTKHVTNNNVDEQKLGIQSLPNSNYENMVIPIGVIADANKEITFSTEVANLPEGLNVYLEDRTANTFTQLDEVNSEYKITLTEKLDGIGRFYLHTTSSALDLKEVDLNSIRIYQTSNSNLMIAGLPQGKSTFKLFNLLGKEILNNSFSSSGNKEIVLPNLASGIYIVQLETESGKLNKKITLE